MRLPEPVRVKICGLTDPVAIAACVEAGADWVGFNFFSRSPRFVTPDDAAALQAAVPRRIGSVALLVKPSDDEIEKVVAAMSLAAVQIYDTPQRCGEIASRWRIPVWQALGVADCRDLPQVCTSDALVIESRAPADAERPGGNGQRFDWGITRHWQAPVPWLLAGGLAPDNVAHAIRESRASAVDVASGVETAPGHKDPTLIRAFVAAARQEHRPAA